AAEIGDEAVEDRLDLGDVADERLDLGVAPGDDALEAAEPVVEEAELLAQTRDGEGRLIRHLLQLRLGRAAAARLTTRARACARRHRRGGRLDDRAPAA